ncbi:addiction module protein [Candidatus Magnetobacterium casense]|uniref:addiction module protein n=1 Tax=Candidatus Magnetobacterium casense TaxID=1455061 RepID=UPI00190F1511|nr:addiction module protein [Candidatus Magnetobacterium casensis]
MFSLSDILKLSISERIILVETIWDTIIDSPGDIVLTDIQKTEIERRLAAYYDNRGAGDSWENVKDRILNSK